MKTRTDWIKQCHNIEITALKKNNGDLNVENTALKSREASIQKKAKDLVELEDRLMQFEKALTKEQNEISVFKATYSLNCEKDKTEFAFGWLNTLVKNPTFTKKVIGTTGGGGLPTFDQYGSSHYPSPDQTDLTELTKLEV